MQKKYIEIAELIREDILRGVYPLGSNIPAIRTLALRYKVNPQTINKSTAYLASLGYLEARVGSGSMVCKPAATTERPHLPMLIDSFRARLLTDLNDVANYHGKDIYLSYLMLAAQQGKATSFMVYERDETATPPDFIDTIGRAEGVLVQGTLPQKRIELLAQHNIPTVMINRHCPAAGPGRFGSVLIPNDHIVDLVNLLLSLGHTAVLFAFSNRFTPSKVFDDRLALARQAWLAGGQPEEKLQSFVYSENSALDAKRLAAAVASGFTSVIAYNDVSALGLYGLAALAELRLPADLSIVGFDDIAMAQLSSPSLTTIRVDRRDLMQQAFSLMDTLATSPDGARLEKAIHTELVIRQSAFRSS
ncbi:MAG: GntR family transcriptional regulator [Spirochaetes bacterium]|nr:GntR family transcriptional regulator [Spirochaetota bacterium]